LKAGGSLVLNVILAILVLSIIVIVHEFGHFIVAKANGVTVVEFCLGFGPKLIHFKKGETEYSIKLLPFGGACIMLGEEFLEAIGNGKEDDEDEEEDESQSDESRKNAINKKALENGFDMSKSFSSKSVWARIAIIAAGPLFNFIFAFILAVVIIGCVGFDPCTVDKVYNDSPAATAGLQEGDRIVKVNGEGITFAREYSFYRYYHASSNMDITYVRDGKKYTTSLSPEYTTTKGYRIGITITENCMVSTVSENTPAAKAGMKTNDVVKSINGDAISNGTQLSEYLANTKDSPVDIVISRDGAEKVLRLTPELVENKSYYTGMVCLGNRVMASPAATVGYAFKEVGYWIELVLKSVGMMFTGQVGINDLSGPVGTVSFMSSVVEESKANGAFTVLLSLFNLGVMISANLGVMNLLPLPALDGGRLVFFLIEAVRGKPVKKEREGMVHFIGMVLLMALMVYVLFKDIRGLF
jgi:regulator of sigma E protease